MKDQNYIYNSRKELSRKNQKFKANGDITPNHYTKPANFKQNLKFLKFGEDISILSKEPQWSEEKFPKKNF